MAKAQESETVVIPADEPGFDRGSLESTVASKMASVFTDDSEELENLEKVPDRNPTGTSPAARRQAKVEEEPIEEEKETPETKDQPAEKKPTEEAESEPADRQDAPTPDAGTSSTLPAAYIRSLKAAEWTDEEIAAGLESNPERFLQMAERVHASRNSETKRWAELGQQQKQAQTGTQVPPAAAVQAPPAGLQQIDIEALRKKYGDEPFVAEMAKANQMMQQVQGVQEWMKQSQERQARAEMETLGRQVDAFFSSDELKPYSDLYGASAITLTPEQHTARTKLLETADLIAAGARGLNRTITLDEILQRAHESVSGPVKTKAATKVIASQVQKRSNALTIKPGSRVAPLSDSPKAKRAKLETTVKEGLKVAFKQS